MTRFDELGRKLLSRERVYIFAYGLDGRILLSEGEGLKSIGLKPGDLVGESIYHLAHDDAENIDHLKRALKGESFIAVGGYAGRQVEVQFSPMLDEQRNIVGVWGVGINVSERERLLHEKDMLIRAGQALSESLDYEATLERVARVALPVLADYCLVDLADEHGRLRQLAVAHVDPLKEDRAFELQRRYSYTLDRDYATYRVLQSRKAELHSEVTPAMLDAYARDDEERELFRALAPRSVMLVPMLSQGQALGVMSLSMSDSGRTYTSGYLELATTLARAAARAVQNAQLYRQAMQQRR